MKHILLVFVSILISASVYAKSERLNNPALERQYVCMAKATAARLTAEHVWRGVPKEKFLADNPFPEGLSDEQKLAGLKMVDDAYVWPRSPYDFADYEYQECMIKSKE